MEFKKYDESDLRSTDYRDDKTYPWEFIANVAGDNSHLFDHEDGWVDNNEVAHRLKKMGAVTHGMMLDPESSCFYAYFESRAIGEAFLKKLTAYLSQKANLIDKAKSF